MSTADSCQCVTAALRLGSMDEDEFRAMLELMGCVISPEQVKTMIGDAKDRFAAWKYQADAENVAKCRRIWNSRFASLGGHPSQEVFQECAVFEAEDSEDQAAADPASQGSLGLKEINGIIFLLNKFPGSSLPRFTAAGFLAEFGDGMTFDCFSEWFLEKVACSPAALQHLHVPFTAQSWTH